MAVLVLYINCSAVHVPGLQIYSGVGTVLSTAGTIPDRSLPAATAALPRQAVLYGRLTADCDAAVPSTQPAGPSTEVGPAEATELMKPLRRPGSRPAVQLWQTC